MDADPDSAEINGYPIDVLYTNLGKLGEAKSVRVFLDACFSGDSDRGMLVRSASPVYVQAALPEASGEKLTVLAAASGQEVASWDDEARHGLFTHHLMDALYGAGDADGDGRVTAAEAKLYLDDTMTLAARREFGRHQNASLNGLARAVLAVSSPGGFPPRPALDGGEAPKVAGGDEEVGEPARSAEAALVLTRAQRVSVQRGLGALGYDVGPADGLFGRRTRAGIEAYQKTKGLGETGYLTAEQSEAAGGAGRGDGARSRGAAEGAGAAGRRSKARGGGTGGAAPGRGGAARRRRGVCACGGLGHGSSIRGVSEEADRAGGTWQRRAACVTRLPG